MEKLTDTDEIEQRPLNSLPIANTFPNRGSSESLPSYNETLEPLELLTQETTNHNRFTIGETTFMHGITVVSIFGSAQKPILSVITTPSANTSVNSSNTLIPRSSVIEMNVAGHLVITGMENAQVHCVFKFVFCSVNKLICSKSSQSPYLLVKNFWVDWKIIRRWITVSSYRTQWEM